MDIKKRIEEVVQNGTLQSGEEITYIETDDFYAIFDAIANSSSDIQNVGEILIWIVKNSQHQVWSISRSEEEAKEILKHHQKDYPDEYFYIESEEI